MDNNIESKEIESRRKFVIWSSIVAVIMLIVALWYFWYAFARLDEIASTPSSETIVFVEKTVVETCTEPQCCVVEEETEAVAPSTTQPMVKATASKTQAVTYCAKEANKSVEKGAACHACVQACLSGTKNKLSPERCIEKCEYPSSNNDDDDEDSDDDDDDSDDTEEQPIDEPEEEVRMCGPGKDGKMHECQD